MVLKFIKMPLKDKYQRNQRKKENMTFNFILFLSYKTYI